MDYEKAVKWVDNRTAEVEYMQGWKCWIVRVDGFLVVAGQDHCKSWIEAVNLAMMRS